MPLPAAISTRWRDSEAHHRATLIGILSVVPLLLWWLGWFPGLLSSDSIDQLGQVNRFEFSNQHPAAHSLLMWLITRLWDHAGMITLVQVVAMAAVLAFIAGRLARAGLPAVGAGVVAIGIAALPAVSATTITIWKDVPYTVCLLWAFGELLGLATDPGGWDRRTPVIRLGLALAGVWLFRHNGFLTVVPVLVVAWLLCRRTSARGVYRAGVTALGVVAGIMFLLYSLVGVDRGSIEPGTVFISDVAASLHHEPHNFSDTELEYLSRIAPLEVWSMAYDCHDSTPLVFSPAFDSGVITADPGRFRSLVFDTYLRDPDTVLGHRWCAASYLVVPWQPDGAYFQRPPFDIPANDLGIDRDPISDRMFDVTFSIFQWAEPDSRLWLTWRPGLAVVGGSAAIAALAWRRRINGLGVAIALFTAQLANVALTTPAQEFRFAFALYVIGWLWVAVAAARLVGSDGAVATAEAGEGTR